MAKWHALIRVWLVRTLRRALLPLKVLALGHFWLVSYLVALSIALISAAKWLNKVLIFQISAFTQAEGFVKWLATSLTAFIPVALAVAIMLMLISSVMLVTRVIWRHHRFALGEIVQLTPRTLLISVRAILMTARRAFSTLFPALAMLALYFFTDHGPGSAGTQRMYEIVMLAVTIVCVYRTMPVLMAPFIAVCGAVGAREAIYYSPQLFHRKAPEMLISLIFSAGFALMLLALLRYSGIYEQYRYLCSLIVVIIGGWYAITSLSIFTMNTLKEHAEAQSLMAQAATQADASTQPNAAGQPASAVQVNRIWVK